MRSTFTSVVLFIQNGEEDGPGLFARVLQSSGVGLEVLHAWRGEAIPADIEGYSGLAIGGGAIGAYQVQEYPFLESEMQLIRSARITGTPVLGLCLGAQLIAGALGGQVHPHHTKEIGFFEVRLSPAAGSDPLWAGLDTTFRPVHWHSDTFTLPPDAVLLGSSSLTPNQLFRCGDNLYGLQFHLEFDLPVLSAMIESDAESLREAGVDPTDFLRAANERLAAVEPIAEAVFARWTTLLG